MRAGNVHAINLKLIQIAFAIIRISIHIMKKGKTSQVQKIYSLALRNATFLFLGGICRHTMEAKKCECVCEAETQPKEVELTQPGF